MSEYSFPKSEKLKSRKLISQIFREGKSVYKFPIRAVFLDISGEGDLETNRRVAFSVPKKKIARAVDRNLIKRRMHEAYRLNRVQKDQNAKPYDTQSCKIIVFIYLLHEISSYRIIESAMKKLLAELK